MNFFLPVEFGLGICVGNGQKTSHTNRIVRTIFVLAVRVDSGFRHSCLPVHLAASVAEAGLVVCPVVLTERFLRGAD